MTETEFNAKPPYPTIGESCQLLAGAFGTKSADPLVRKKLDRLAREGDFDWSLRQQVVEALLVEPLRDLGLDFSDFVGGFADFLLDEHIELLSGISLDAMSREDAAPLLIETKYAAHVAAFLMKLRDKLGGPDLGGFFEEGANPVGVVLQWAERMLGFQVAATAFPDDKQKRDDVGRWRRGDTIPDFFGSILPLRRELVKRRPDREPGIVLFCKWLTAARALSWLDREARAANFGSLLDLVRREILLNCPARDVGRRLSLANIEAASQLREIKEFGLLLRNGKLGRGTAKRAGDQIAARRELDRFKALLDEQVADGRAGYMLDWCEGRWHVLAGDEEKALEFYEKGADRVLYRAGPNQKDILEEGLSLAAYLGNKPAIKRLKHRALAVGLFSDQFSKLPEKPDVVSEWEVKQLAGAFTVLFPAHARFMEAPRSNFRPPLPFPHFDQSAINCIRPNLTNPDRIINIPTIDGSKYRRPQLVWFASENRVDDVRRLLEAGANVNKSDEEGGSALLCALQCAQKGRGRQVLDLLLEWPHEKETLDRLTAKKRLSPLYIAVLLGEPEVVARLLEMGASPDLPVSLPPQTPLYICVERFALYRPERAAEHLRRRMVSPQPVDQEIQRRYSGGKAGPFGDRLSVLASDSRYDEIMSHLVGHAVHKAIQPPRAQYLRIAEILLGYGADPNRKHFWPAPGRSPLMTAAENNAADVFRLMVDSGGDPYLKDDEGNDCYAIARGFESRDVIQNLER